MRGAVGAALGILLAGALTMLLTGGGGEAGGLPWLVAPLGASAVLVFAVPASPLAQPWPVIGGNLLSAAGGIFMGPVVGTPQSGKASCRERVCQNVEISVVAV